MSQLSLGLKALQQARTRCGGAGLEPVGFRVFGLGFRVEGLGFWVYGVGGRRISERPAACKRYCRSTFASCTEYANKGRTLQSRYRLDSVVETSAGFPGLIVHHAHALSPENCLDEDAGEGNK